VCAKNGSSSVSAKLEVNHGRRVVTLGVLLPRDAMQARPMPSCGLSVCVCPSVTFVDSVKTCKRFFNFFSPSGSHTILVFPYQTSWEYSDTDPLTGVSNAGGVG